MIQSKYKWVTKKTDNVITEDTIKAFNITPLMQSILESKGITSYEDIDQMLNTKTVTHDTARLSDIQRATNRIQQAIKAEEPILVYGDYDADGVTSTSILVQTLKKLGAVVGWYIPNRFSEGYGPSEVAFKNAYDEGVKLIITVDNGIQGHNEIDMVQQLGVDVIVTDHHEMGDTLPNAYAIIHPMHPDYDYPFQYLCGAGVALKLAQHLLDDIPDYFWVYAMIGTIADLVPMRDENRSIVRKGLKLINHDMPVALKALLNEANYDDAVNEETIGFTIGPRLNAVGRLDDASLAAELLMTNDEDEAQFLAEQVEHFNQERKTIVQAVTEEAMIMAQAQVAEGQRFLVLYQEDWHEGILGIVASRIVESYQRPTMILNIDHEKQHAKGSARSISQISMFELLSTQADLIDKFGGHHAAAGLTLPIENVESLKQALNEVMKNQYKEDALQPEKYIDAAVALDTVTVENIASLERLRPFGMQFERPLFQLNHLTIQQARAIGQQQNHLKISFVEQKLQGLFWNEGSRIHEIMPNQHINAIGELQINEWNGNRTPQLIVTDIHSNERQMFDYRSKNKKLPQFETTSNTCYLIHPSSDKRHQHEYYYGESIPNDYEKCVFLELPLTIDDFKESLQHISASQVYVQFTHQKSIYFEGIPKIDTFKKCYKLLYQQKEIDLTKEGLNMSRFLQIKPQLLKFILKVFLDLQFITQNNGIIKIDTTATKQDITSSRIYQGRLHRIEVEKQLLYSDFPALQQWMENAMQEEE
ncbi:single-stranded-DNA-specific exonuclease RecJ [Staphylococcus agnetis]|uniref:single-stranded-DNA-specific exonuclease RecJ n=1 Tax=Staphylococcus agnetis TaxID=985762 RepID=UPI00208F8686|nr:single-stranded-DNA-specific exonuclease RecJ [Staphylococcus agnetis]MCO4337647.1 single-stranded-DNA-specific exonuclease RecJ [Staphylococcus agnetis]MCO4340944.1 single-stranded-DNA-specific exonuclease RecJ [Staphylococcus agnetis]MCO4342623.1 single-stranded-DNA-specific exonuclease RecJ [Staphylococcus agnetis]MCO4344721.1 single-stranded-DNA-specific exonuclease RecJ [Staphylococcus agnetis]MCO4348004.1 single-stranded-DNA-specific exonuclease RecJ [Staphylococcus agnetis]